MKTAVTSVIDGGIGNQMFQYAAARALGAKLGAELDLDLRRLDRRGHRTFDLAGFRLAPGLRLIREGKPPRPPGAFARLVRPTFGLPDYYLEASFPYNPEVADLSAPVILDGYFQSERYFLGHEELIRSDFTPKDEHAEAIERVARRALPDGLSVSMHVRRGDYVEPKNQAFHGLVPLAYYGLALDALAERLGDTPVICVFTDDPAWVRANLPLPPSTRYVSESTSSALEDLILMSRCSHHITANSSFSWWGAWLNQAAGKIVITPSEWFRPASGIDTRDLRPPGWLVV